MRVMVIVQATRNSEAGVLPGEQTLAAMGRLDFGDALTPESRAHEDRLRAATEKANPS